MQKQPLVTELKEGLLLVDKPQGKTSFSLISALRRLTGIKKIGHAGTLDPFATGVMVLLVGRRYTKLADTLLAQNKRYKTQIHLGVSTDTYDCEGSVVAQSKKRPTQTQINEVVEQFQGEILQVPPMFSAKKINGEKLYTLARKGITIERKPCPVKVHIEILEFAYPYLNLEISCTKGTYIRSLGHEIGEKLGCGAHLSQLRRIESGEFHIDNCLSGTHLFEKEFNVTPYLKSLPDAEL